MDMFNQEPTINTFSFRKQEFTQITVVGWAFVSRFPVSVSLSQPLSVGLFLSVSASLSLLLCLCMCFCLSVCLSVSLVCVCMCVCVCVSLSLSLSLSLSILSACLLAFLSSFLHHEEHCAHTFERLRTRARTHPDKKQNICTHAFTSCA